MTVDGAADGLPEPAAALQGGRPRIATLAELDPISEDSAIGIVASLEKQHGLLRSQKDA